MERMPREVKDALERGDEKALRNMASKGGKHAAALRALEKGERIKKLNDLAAEQERLYHLSSEGDVLPPDPHVLASLDEEKQR